MEESSTIDSGGNAKLEKLLLNIWKLQRIMNIIIYNYIL